MGKLCSECFVGRGRMLSAATGKSFGVVVDMLKKPVTCFAKCIDAVANMDQE